MNARARARDVCGTCGHRRDCHSTNGGMCAGDLGGSECHCSRFPDAPDFTDAPADDVYHVTGSRVSLGQERRQWLLVERYIEHYPDDWRLLFRSGEDVLEVQVPEEVWRAFDA